GAEDHYGAVGGVGDHVVHHQAVASSVGNAVGPPAVGSASRANHIVSNRRVLALRNSGRHPSLVDVEGRPASPFGGRDVLDRLIRARVADLDQSFAGLVPKLAAIAIHLDVLNGDPRLTVAVNGFGERSTPDTQEGARLIGGEVLRVKSLVGRGKSHRIAQPENGSGTEHRFRAAGERAVDIIFRPRRYALGQRLTVFLGPVGGTARAR